MDLLSSSSADVPAGGAIAGSSVQTHFSHNFSLGGGGTRTIPHVVPFYRVSVYILPDVLEQTRRTLQRRENEGVSDRLKWG